MDSWQITAQHFLFAQCVLSVYLSHPWKQSPPASALELRVEVTETAGVKKRTLVTISVPPQKLLSELLYTSYGSGQNGGDREALSSSRRSCTVSLSGCSYPASLARHVHRKGFVDRLDLLPSLLPRMARKLSFKLGQSRYHFGKCYSKCLFRNCLCFFPRNIQNVLWNKHSINPDTL